MSKYLNQSAQQQYSWSLSPEEKAEAEDRALQAAITAQKYRRDSIAQSIFIALITRDLGDHATQAEHAFNYADAFIARADK